MIIVHNICATPKKTFLNTIGADLDWLQTICKTERGQILEFKKEYI